MAWNSITAVITRQATDLLRILPSEISRERGAWFRKRQVRDWTSPADLPTGGGGDDPPPPLWKEGDTSNVDDQRG